MNATTTAAGSFLYSPPAGTALGAGQQTLTTTFTPTDATKYTTATSSVTLKVNLAAPALSVVGSSINPSLTSSPVTFTASATANAGMPTGSIAFFDGSTQLGSVMLAAGSASLTTSTLAAGSHAITAVYSGDANFVTMTSAVLTQVVESYSITTSSVATVSPGGQASYLLAVTPPSVGASLTFSITGLPAGATATFSPSTVAAGSAPTNVTLTVILPATADVRPINRPSRHDDPPVLLGLLLLPFAGKLRIKSWAKRVPFLLGMVGILIAAGVSGCGSGGGAGAGTGGGLTPTSYSLTVTAVSGSLTQSTKLTLTVK